MIRRDALVISIGIALGLGGLFAATRPAVPTEAKQTANVTPENEDLGLSETNINNEPTVPILQMDEVRADREPSVPKLEIEDISASARDDPFAPVASVNKSNSSSYTSDTKASVPSGDDSGDVIKMELDQMALEIANNIVRFKTKTAGRRVRTTGYIGVIGVEGETICIAIISDNKSGAGFSFSKEFESKVAALNVGHTVTLDGYYVRTDTISGHEVPMFDGADVVSSSPRRYVSPEERYTSTWMGLMELMVKGASESKNR